MYNKFKVAGRLWVTILFVSFSLAPLSVHMPATHVTDQLIYPQELNTRLGLNQMELARTEIISDELPLILPGSLSRLVATQVSFDSRGYLKLGADSFWGNAPGVSALMRQGVKQMVLLEIMEHNDDSWIENAVTDMYHFVRPDVFIIGNELNLKIFRYQNPATYYRQLSTAYRKIKQINPNTSVYSYGTSPSSVYDYERPEIIMEEMLNYFDKNPYSVEQKYPFDGINVHVYLPNQFEEIEKVRKILANHDTILPVMVGETGLHVSDVRPREWNSHVTTLDDHANYLWQSVALSFSYGAEYVIYHTTKDYLTDIDEYRGLYRIDGSSRPALNSFKFAQRIFNNVAKTKYENENNVVVFTIYRTDGLQARIIWNNSTDPKAFSKISRDTLVFDRYGKPITISASDTLQLKISLPGRYTHFVAGDVLILIDRQIGLPRYIEIE